jgi:hypothetical protein
MGEEGMTYRIVDTDNFGGDWPDEKFVGPEFLNKMDAEAFADGINAYNGDLAPRYHKVVEMPYELQPGFEP